ncbi:uncharacterized protein LACBIDRAFT_328209 [Laccaria bicolor S238N-H82]|uniref:Predicted protein n=1 Tax=Laccaria bicolor (strain S238N-H82 / ATCC MYA-4686) TaxID=486041 RepID=B0DE32_LACBS|nr:uncharacterized protein LACBIDRAFT_328209 [Laccaria bicolor S238N-H82]EDR07195.1 predicted protein [Laccaria bicolor S238N-H82]|eukprot:XP_001882126.1 predicted protein [Laccaria bicolor S238N-H82]
MDKPVGTLEVLADPNGGSPPLDFEDFKDQIDTHGGYVLSLALSIDDFYDELDREEAMSEQFAESIKQKIENDDDNLTCSEEQKDFLRTFVVSTLIPDLRARYDEMETEDPYLEEGRSFLGKAHDDYLLQAVYFIHKICKREKDSGGQTLNMILRDNGAVFLAANLAKWYWFFWQVLWADRITVRKCFGCLPFFMVTGAHPLIPLNVQEATWPDDYNQAFQGRIIPYFARTKIMLPNDIYEIIDLNKESLDKLDEEGLEDRVDSNDYYFKHVNLDQSVQDDVGGMEADDDDD